MIVSAEFAGYILGNAHAVIFLRIFHVGAICLPKGQTTDTERQWPSCVKSQRERQRKPKNEVNLPFPYTVLQCNCNEMGVRPISHS